MITVLLVIHLMVAIALVALVLLQRSEGGALGMGGGGMSGFLTGRGTSNLLTRTTAILAAVFIVTSLALAKLSGMTSKGTSILGEEPPAVTTPAPPPPPSEPAPPIAR